MKKIEKLIWISISAALAFYIFLQHRYVYMYFDDYGYASYYELPDEVTFQYCIYPNG